MLPLHHDPHDTFRFADDRIIPRFKLEGVEAGRGVAVFQFDPATGGRLGRLTAGLTGDGGWVDVPEQIVVRAGDAFVAVPREAGAGRTTRPPAPCGRRWCRPPRCCSTRPGRSTNSPT